MTKRAPSSSIQEHRIIDRPRLISALDECGSKAILLLAPAGYGKTTLARQWIETVGRAIWLSCTPTHRDVVTLASDVADHLAPFDEAAQRVVREYVRAQNTPQKSSRRIGSILAEHVNSAQIQWLVIDDYHEIIEAPEVEQLVDVLHRESAARLLIASRIRPSWATARRIVYGEIQLWRRALESYRRRTAFFQVRCTLISRRSCFRTLVRSFKITSFGSHCCRNWIRNQLPST